MMVTPRVHAGYPQERAAIAASELCEAVYTAGDSKVRTSFAAWLGCRSEAGADQKTHNEI